MDLKLIKPEDYRYIVKNPDPSFSPTRNKAIINETVRDTEKFFTEIVEKLDDEMGERIDILATYGTYRFNRGEKSFDKYAGKKLVARLVGEKILERVRVMETVNRLNGNNKFKNFIQL